MLNVLIGMAVLAGMLIGSMLLVAGFAFLYDRWFYDRFHAPAIVIRIFHYVKIALVIGFVLILSYAVGQSIRG